MCVDCRERREGDISVCGVKNRRDVPAKTSPRMGFMRWRKDNRPSEAEGSTYTVQRSRGLQETA